MRYIGIIDIWVNPAQNTVPDFVFQANFLLAYSNIY